MGWTREVWRKNVSLMLFEMSNLEFQRAIWNAKIQGLVSTFLDLVDEIDAYAIPEALEHFVQQGIVSDEEAKVLRRFEAKIDDFIKDNDGIFNWEVEQVLCHPDWIAISKMAADIFKTYFENDFIAYPEYESLLKQWAHRGWQ